MPVTTKARPAVAAVAASAGSMRIAAFSSPVEAPAPTSVPAVIVPIAGPAAALSAALNWGYRSSSQLENPGANNPGAEYPHAEDLATPAGGQAVPAAVPAIVYAIHGHMA